jgi:S1-C subfamily serine protease
MIRYLLLFVLCASCSFTVQPADLPPSFYGIDVAETTSNDGTAFLGVQLELLQSEDIFSLDVQPGVLIKRVDDKSPAAQAGVVVGDILLSYDGHQTDDPQRVYALLATERKARSVELEIQRGSQVLVTKTQLVMKSESEMRSKYFIERGLLRVAFTNSDSGLPQIAELDEQSPLLAGGAEVGDVILKYQSSHPGSASELVRRIRLGLAPGDAVSMTLQSPDGSSRIISCKAWSPETFVTEVGLWPLFYWQRYPGRDKGVFTCGNLVLLDLFSYKRDGSERHYSVFGIFDWKTGELILEEE